MILWRLWERLSRGVEEEKALGTEHRALGEGNKATRHRGIKTERREEEEGKAGSLPRSGQRSRAPVGKKSRKKTKTGPGKAPPQEDRPVKNQEKVVVISTGGGAWRR
jgi:hypothetical protein